MKNVVAVLILVFISFGASAENVPDILSSGFSAYKSNGPKSAIEAWVKGSSMEGSKEALSQANMFRQIEDYYGSYQGFDLFKTNSLGPRANLYLITINYEKGLLFAKFFTYEQVKGDEIMLNFKFHTETDMVWPPNMVYGD